MQATRGDQSSEEDSEDEMTKKRQRLTDYSQPLGRINCKAKEKAGKTSQGKSIKSSKDESGNNSTQKQLKRSPIIVSPTPEAEENFKIINTGPLPEEGQYQIYSTVTSGYGIINLSTGSRRRGRPLRYQSSLKDHLDSQAISDLPANLGPSLEELIGRKSMTSLRK
uniref:Uncharacterized protein n=1 Tax=Nelumbo nucifera TaxID=4432 RepID=A0A822ZWL2_NELNU|nr:TPA_asm: hypothetical protein HUJ06_017576 [Nelumbo nucifera]